MAEFDWRPESMVQLLSDQGYWRNWSTFAGPNAPERATALAKRESKATPQRKWRAVTASGEILWPGN